MVPLKKRIDGILYLISVLIQFLTLEFPDKPVLQDYIDGSDSVTIADLFSIVVFSE